MGLLKAYAGIATAWKREVVAEQHPGETVACFLSRVVTGEVAERPVTVAAEDGRGGLERVAIFYR